MKARRTSRTKQTDTNEVRESRCEARRHTKRTSRQRGFVRLCAARRGWLRVQVGRTAAVRSRCGVPTRGNHQRRPPEATSETLQFNQNDSRRGWLGSTKGVAHRRTQQGVHVEEQTSEGITETGDDRGGWRQEGRREMHTKLINRPEMSDELPSVSQDTEQLLCKGESNRGLGVSSTAAR
jgi:hypothetical protein